MAKKYGRGIGKGNEHDIWNKTGLTDMVEGTTSLPAELEHTAPLFDIGVVAGNGVFSVEPEAGKDNSLYRRRIARIEQQKHDVVGGKKSLHTVTLRACSIQ